MGVPIVATVHTLMIPAAQKLERTGLMSIAIRLQAPVSRSFEESELDTYRIRPRRVVTVGVGVHDLFLESPDSVSKSTPPYVFYSGRLGYNKGLFDLIASAKHVCRQRPDVLFVLAGSGPLQKRPQEAAGKFGVAQNVRFVGQVNDRAHMRKLHRQASVAHGIGSSVADYILRAFSSGELIARVKRHQNCAADNEMLHRLTERSILRRTHDATRNYLAAKSLLRGHAHS